MGATKLRHKPRLLYAPIKMAARGKFEPAWGPSLDAEKIMFGWAEYFFMRNIFFLVYLEHFQWYLL